jgi:hypothetical protein
MRIREILDIDRETGENADLLMRQISNAFTRHGHLKGISGFGYTGDTPLDEPPLIPAPDDDPADAASFSTRTRSPVPGREQPEMAQVNNPQLYAKPIDLVGPGGGRSPVSARAMPRGRSWSPLSNAATVRA